MTTGGDDSRADSGSTSAGARASASGRATDRVDVLAFDEPVERAADERKREQLVSLGTYAVVAAVVALGFVRAMLLPSVLAAAALLGLRAVLVGDRATAVETRYRTVPAGEAANVVAAHEREARKRRRTGTYLLGVVVAVPFGYSLVRGSLLLGVLSTGTVSVVAWFARSDPDLPRVVEGDVDRERARRLFDLDADRPEHATVESVER